jgi:hypothetical protein
MNLAKMLSIVFLLACACAPAVTVRAMEPGTQAAQSSPTASTPATTQSDQIQQTSLKHHKHQKTAASSNCSSGTAAKNDSKKKVGGEAPAANCAPPKTVVKNGGTSEPAEQLTGGEGAAQAQDRSTTDQLLGSTDDNLKKIAGRQLTSAQQDMVMQIRQYIAQSKEAVTAGDTERGRMLAQKAQLLSDELTKP